LAGLGGALVGAAIGFLSFRYGLRGSYFALVTLAFAEVFRILANSVAFTGGGVGTLIPLNQTPLNFQFADKRAFYYVVLALVAAGLVLTRWLENSRFGARLMAVRENEDAARALGVDAFAVKLRAIALSGGMAGLAGAFYAQYFLYIDPRVAYGSGISVEALLAPIIGGLGTVFGPILGAIVLHGAGEIAKQAMGDAIGLNLVLYGVMLIVEGVSKSFGGLRAVDNVSVHVMPGEIVALIGPNGAGKTTLFSIVAGFQKADRGTIHFAGQDVSGLTPDRICELGLVRTFQIVQPFAGLTVRQNIAVGAHLRHAGRGTALAQAERVAAKLGMAAMLDQPASGLTVSGSNRLELARALATEPRFLLLDEVMAGLNPSEIAEIMPTIRTIRDSGVTVLLTEHVMQAVMNLAERIYVLNNGRLIAEGSPAQIAADPQVIEAYLGHGAAERLKQVSHG
jgi:branched-chain amino acid transport system ATP-binding protein